VPVPETPQYEGPPLGHTAARFAPHPYGYGTDWQGEAEVATWELRAGCRTFDVYCLDIAGMIIGLFMSPARLWHAFVAAKGQSTLYRDPVLCESAMQMTVGEVRARLGIPPGGLNA